MTKGGKLKPDRKQIRTYEMECTIKFKYDADPKNFPDHELPSQMAAVDSIAFEENPELLADLIMQLDYSVRIDPTGREVNEA